MTHGPRGGRGYDHADAAPVGRLDGKTAIVTAGSRGIGLAVARRLVREGTRVVITARKQPALDEAVDALGGPSWAVAVAGSADDDAHQRLTVTRTLETFGSIDFLVNNAGINPVYGDLMDLSLDPARKILEVNCLGAIGWTQKVHRAWMADHGGAIVNLSSLGGVVPSRGLGFYGASKAMLTHLTKQFALELSPAVRVNAVAPAVIKTRFAAALYEGREEAVAATYPLGRLGAADDVASCVAFLLSDEAGWITGQQIVLDGGIMLTGGL